MLHMQQVLSAIQALRQQLQLQTGGDVSSIEQDKQHMERLKKKIAEHKDELLKMKDELINVQAEEIKKGEGAGLSDVELRAKAKELVDKIMEEVKR